MNDSNRASPHQPALSQEIAADLPARIGRYRIEKILGEGGFGLVYLAHDSQLHRLVAVKVPHRKLVDRAEAAEAYRTEARTVAGLDHPNIVPVYDVGSTEDCPCFVVSKYIDGSTLAQRIQGNRPSVTETAELTATVAETLHYAHRNRLVHRDVKPSNILLDQSNKPFVSDFGLALREQDLGQGPRYAGTPPYMSPEQARGEGHRVDGRSDIFSLGVVLYELLTGQRPFSAASQEELLEQIANLEVRPPRQWDDAIPKELERICLKALSKRASERYTTAMDMADDLRHWLRPLSGGRQSSEVGSARSAQAVVEPALATAPGLNKLAFLSYASPDKEAAYRLCQRLEEQGIGCWIAPRDVTPGADYGEAIIRAIEGTATTVLLLSAHANASVHVAHEVERATSKRKRVIPIRLEDIPLSPSLELHLATAHWVDAWRLSPDHVASQLAVVLRGEGLTIPASPVATPHSDQRPLKIVPKGLRSFDAHDADFFLELLPGPRDRDGLPDSLRFWKTRIEEPDPEKTFSVGLICGPSGCGKSSLVKAGLLPRLSDAVLAVYLEATAGETEIRLLHGLRKRCPTLPENLGLKETLAALRRGQGVPPGKKVLIVLDQFEQWLHAPPHPALSPERSGLGEGDNTELVQALRHCDGGRVQCIVLVRDDFWMAVIRFMRELEIRLVEGQNSAAVDLFPIRHAEKVLAAYGRAFGSLTEDNGEASKDQKEFLVQAVNSLSQEGKVISVRLALFAEMMKGKVWTPATLKAVGGAEGVGVTFLEETFGAVTAPPEHRYHQKAARAVLKCLLPESGANIKGHMRSHAELLQASGYAHRQRDFDDLIRMLDSEIRLITPTDPEGKDEASGGSQPPDDAPDQGADAPRSPVRFYQLTHDYLVPSLRDWLTRKQKETRRGRAELMLADRAAVWNARPENRQLPSLRQWCSILCLTQKKNWTPPQRKMMKKAARYHAVWWLTAALILFALTVPGWLMNTLVVEQENADHAFALVKRLLDADIAQTPEIIAEMDGYRRWTDPLLRQEEAAAKDGSRQKLLARLALLPVDEGQTVYLYDRLLNAGPTELPVIRDALLPQRETLGPRLWAVLEDEKNEADQRFRAACALAGYDVTDDDANRRRWEAVAPFVAARLLVVVQQNPSHYDPLLKTLDPVRDRLIGPLSKAFRSSELSEGDRFFAANILAEYAAGRAEVLANLTMDADEKQFAVIYPKFKEQSERGLALMIDEVNRTQPSDATEEAKEKRAKRQANAAVVLLRMNQPENVWPLLKHSPDPRIRSYLIHRLGPLGADPKAIIRRFDEEQDVSIRRALLLSLGECGADQLSAADREPLLPKVRGLYRDDPDPGLHGAADWLLRQWNDDKTLKEMNEQWAKDEPARETRLQQIKQDLLRDQGKATPRWYINSQGQSLVVIPGPVKFLIGSPPMEAGREGGPTGENEQQQEKQISRSFAIAARTVTVGQFLRFRKDHKYDKDYSPTDDSPVNGVSWYGAAAYCNWLSEHEGIAKDQWCYLPNAQGEYGEGMQLAPNYLHRTGYRLPSEAEWEYACRAGAITSRYYGEGEELLGRYAWYTKASRDRGMLPGLPGSRGVRGDCLKPNDFGLFDMLGNAWEWCQDRLAPYKPGEDVEGDAAVKAGDNRLLRGGCFYTQAKFVRSAYRDRSVPSYVMTNNGIRVARTIAP